jgi:serine/threonine protein kinase
LADFGLLRIISDPANRSASSSYTLAGSIRWMSPELFQDSRPPPTKSSDCYALGMVIYEVISGKLPFYDDWDLAVCEKIREGVRPHREVRFTESLWRMLERCWVAQPNDRPCVVDVLQCLETSPGLLPLPSPGPSEGANYHSGDRDFTCSYPGVLNGESDITMALGVVISSGLNKLSNNPLCEVHISDPGREAMSLGIPNQAVSNDGGLHPVTTIDFHLWATHGILHRNHPMLLMQLGLPDGPVSMCKP